MSGLADGIKRVPMCCRKCGVKMIDVDPRQSGTHKVACRRCFARTNLRITRDGRVLIDYKGQPPM